MPTLASSALAPNPHCRCLALLTLPPARARVCVHPCRFASNFANAELATKEDLLLSPRLTIQDLKDSLGVSSLGEQRKLLALLTRLWATEDGAGTAAVQGASA